MQRGKNEQLYVKISAMEHSPYIWWHCEEQPVKYSVLWEDQAGKLLRGQGGHITDIKKLLRDSCVKQLTNFNGSGVNRQVSHTSSELLKSLRRWMDGF